MSSVRVRTAEPADADAAARCQLACWAEAYAGLADPDRLVSLAAGVDERVARWREILAGPTTLRLADDGGRIVGFVSVGDSRDAGPGDPRLEVWALYVRQAYWSTGLGHRLLEAALGQAPASLWVLRDNARGRRFYAGHGFTQTGPEREEPTFGAAEVRLVRREAWAG